MTDQPLDRPIDLRLELTNMLSVVDGNVAITREQMEAIGDHLQTLWGKAHDAHDEGALDIITNVWDRAQLLVEQNASLAFQVSGMGSIAVSALEGERATREALDSKDAELGDLTDAIESVDESHPMLKDFADSIRVEAEEEFQEELTNEIVPEIMETAYEEQNYFLLSNIVELTGCCETAAEVLIEVLDNSHIPTDEQLSLLQALLDSFEVTAKIRHANRIQARQQVAVELRDWNENGH
jgi:hypothetical protein